VNLTGWPAPVYDAATVWVEKLKAAGIDATNDPRSATPPCVLVTIPTKDDTDSRVPCGLTLSWEFVLLAPGSGNADAWLVLERLDTALRAVLGRRARTSPTPYILSAENPPLAAYRVEFDEDIHI
jgi:hypothetical protein